MWNQLTFVPGWQVLVSCIIIYWSWSREKAVLKPFKCQTLNLMLHDKETHRDNVQTSIMPLIHFFFRNLLFSSYLIIPSTFDYHRWTNNSDVCLMEFVKHLVLEIWQNKHTVKLRRVLYILIPGPWLKYFQSKLLKHTHTHKIFTSGLKYINNIFSGSNRHSSNEIRGYKHKTLLDNNGNVDRVATNLNLWSLNL